MDLKYEEYKNIFEKAFHPEFDGPINMDSLPKMKEGQISENTSIAEYLSKTFEVIQPVDLAQGIVKSMLFAVIVASVGCWKGVSAERDAQGVGKATTGAVVTSIFLIVVTDAAMTALFSFVS